MPYEIQLVDVSGYYESCFYCKERSCRGCSLAYESETTVSDLLKVCDLKNNDTFYSTNHKTRGKEVQLVLNWHHGFQKKLFDVLITANKFVRTDSEEEQNKSNVEGGVNI
jgi:hypothetical protein